MICRMLITNEIPSRLTFRRNPLTSEAKTPRSTNVRDRKSLQIEALLLAVSMRDSMSGKMNYLLSKIPFQNKHQLIAMTTSELRSRPADFFLLE